MSAEPGSITSRVTSTEGEEEMEHKGTTVCRTMFPKKCYIKLSARGHIIQCEQ